jgi:broad specificity phosphatase PhoE
MTETMMYEHPENVRDRCNRIKEMVKNKYAGKYKHIAIVAHYNIINYLMAEKFDENSEPLDCLQVGNCEVVQNFLE